ncbi:MAG: hypothetical protein HYY29_01065 [Chloroflexi bacterium]|nr:hypothetical protein [Chloroflexota bacterium]
MRSSQSISLRCSPLNAATLFEFESSLRPLYLDIAIDGQILFDTAGYMQEKLNRISEIIREAGLHRVRVDGELMWEWLRPVKPGAWELEWGGLVERT